MERSSLTLLFENNEKVLNAAVLETFTRGSTSPDESVSARKDIKPGLNPALEDWSGPSLWLNHQITEMDPSSFLFYNSTAATAFN